MPSRVRSRTAERVPFARRAATLWVAWCISASGGGLRADYVMGPAELNATLKAIARARASIEQGAAGQARAQALFAIAAEADDLASMINQEIQSHGMQQRPLIDLAVTRCAELGVRIYVDPRGQRYVYDGAALDEYLEVSPTGPEALKAKFFLLERDFRERNSVDGAALLAIARRADAIRSEYGEAACELDSFAAVSHLERSRLPAAGADAARRRAKALFERVSANCPGTPEATSARRELARMGSAPIRRQP